MLDLTLEENEGKSIERVVDGPDGKLVVEISAKGVAIRPYRTQVPPVFAHWRTIYVDAIQRELEASRRKTGQSKLSGKLRGRVAITTQRSDS